MLVLVGMLDVAAFLSGGWRVPFLFSAVLVIAGLVIRAKVEESADFTESRAAHEVAKVPLVQVFKTASSYVWLGVAASVLGIAIAYFNNTFPLSWTTTPVESGGIGMDRQVIMNILLAMAILQFIWQSSAAKIAERIGGVPVMPWGLILNLLIIVPLFLAIMTANAVAITTVLGILILGGTGYYACSPPSCPRPSRSTCFTGVTLANGLCASLIGGSIPLVAQAVLGSLGPWGVPGFYAVMALVTIGGVWGLHRKMSAREARAAQAPAAS